MKKLIFTLVILLGLRGFSQTSYQRNGWTTNSGSILPQVGPAGGVNFQQGLGVTNTGITFGIDANGNVRESSVGGNWSILNAGSATLSSLSGFGGGASIDVSGNIVGLTFTGSGSGLTSIPAGQLTGIVPGAALSGFSATNYEAQLSTNTPTSGSLLHWDGQNWKASQNLLWTNMTLELISNGVVVASISTNGVITGNGSGLTNVTATAIGYNPSGITVSNNALIAMTISGNTNTYVAPQIFNGSTNGAAETGWYINRPGVTTDQPVSNYFGAYYNSPFYTNQITGGQSNGVGLVWGTADPSVWNDQVIPTGQGTNASFAWGIGTASNPTNINLTLGTNGLALLAGQYFGSGAGLTSLNAAQLTGTITNTLATVGALPTVNGVPVLTNSTGGNPGVFTGSTNYATGGGAFTNLTPASATQFSNLITSASGPVGVVTSTNGNELHQTNGVTIFGLYPTIGASTNTAQTQSLGASTANTTVLLHGGFGVLNAPDGTLDLQDGGANGVVLSPSVSTFGAAAKTTSIVGTSVTIYPMTAPTNTANVYCTTNDPMPGAWNIGPNARFSVTVPGTVTQNATLSTAINIIVSNADWTTAGITKPQFSQWGATYGVGALIITNWVTTQVVAPNSLWVLTNATGVAQINQTLVDKL